MYHKIKKMHNINGEDMDNIKRYNLFILISTLARNIGNVFSSVILYKMGYSVKDILVFYSVVYFTGGIISSLVIFLIGKIKIKYLLILSSMMFSISFYYMSIMHKNIFNLIIFSIIYSIGTYSYHSIRHYLAIKSLNKNKKNSIGNIIIYTNIAIIISSFVSGYIENISTLFLSLIVIMISIIGIIPILRLDIKEGKSSIKFYKIDRNKKIFFILEQGKSIFLSLEPLYIFLFINNSIKYVGITSALIGVSSCIFTYFFVRRVNDKKYFRYFNILLCTLLMFKLNVFNKYIMLFIVFIEGLLLKVYDVVSTENLYDIESINVKGYLIESEIIFCLGSFIISFIFIFINDIRIMLYVLIIFIFISGFIKRN